MTDETGAVEIRRNPDNSIDEIVAHGCDVHIEQMRKTSWFMQIGREVFSISIGQGSSLNISRVETRAP